MAEGSRSKQTTVMWSSVRMDLVRKVGDLLLASDVVYYLDLRAVCHNCRVATPKPPPLSGVADPRFRPRDWVRLDLGSLGEDEQNPAQVVHGRLFLQLSTGRSVRLCVPQLKYDDYILVGASDGLLVLGGSKGLHPAHLLNPFTADMLAFAAPIPQEKMVLTAVDGSSPTILFSFDDYYDSSLFYVYCAETTSPLCEVQFKGFEDVGFELKSLLCYAGHFYMVEYGGGIFKVVGTALHYHGELIAQPSANYNADYFLVESAVELLLISPGHKRVQVFKVDIERKLLKLVSNIGSRAIFLGARCLSVDADKLPSVLVNCIYYLDHLVSEVDENIHMYDLGNIKLERFPCTVEDHSGRSIPIRPFSMVQTLLDYCCAAPDICAQVEYLRKTCSVACPT